MPNGSWDTFVGRAAELDVLGAALSRAEAGDGSVVLVSGEPGIGKSCLIDHFATDARKRNARVVWGRCWEAGGAPSYWPWVQAMRGIVRDADPATLATLTAVGAPDLAQIIPDLRVALPDLPEPSPADPDTARFRLFDAIASFFRAVAARESALVIALDDVHGADTPSLLLLQFLARELRDARIFLIVSYRSTEVTPGHTLAATFAELTRVPNTRRLSLEGLVSGEISEYLLHVIGGDIDPAVIDAVEARTDGNPLFVSEIIRLIIGDSRSMHAPVRLPDEIPEGVQEAIARRVAKLSDVCRATLEAGAILGREIPVDVLQTLVDADADDLLDALDEAIAAGILLRTPGAAGDLRFSHVLVRDALYDGLPTATRARAHQRAAETLEQLRAHDLEPHLSEIAYHYIAAGRLVDPALATRYAALAGESAVRRLAYEEASRLLRAALQLTERAPALDDTRLDLLLALGDAEARVGDLAGARSTFHSAADLARRQQRPDALARAVLGYGGRLRWLRAGTDTALIGLLEEALVAVGTEDSLLRVQLLSRLSGARRGEPDGTRRRIEASEAVAIARRLGEERALTNALIGYSAAIWDCDAADERLQVAEEAVDHALRTDDAEEVIIAYCARSTARWELGDFTGARADVDIMAPLAARLRQPAQRWLVAISQAAVALFEGRFADVEQLAIAGRNEGVGSLLFDADAAFLTQLALLRLEQGRADEVFDELTRAADAYPWYPHLRALLARAYAAAGQPNRARSLVEMLAPSDFAAVPNSNYSNFTFAMLTEVVAELHDETLAASLLRRLLPYAQRNAMAPPEASAGWVTRPLGVLCGILGRVHESEKHFEEALAQHRKMGARPWLARTHHQYARMLLDNGTAAADERVRAHLDHAVAIARELDMTDLLARASAGDTPPEPATGTCSFRREGEYWTITYAARSIRLRHSKGLVYLGALLARPAHDIAAVDLSALGDGVADSPRRAGRDAADVLDPRARAAYRQRIEDLQAELDEAEEWADSERAHRAREELEFLAHELAAATGLGGRDRTFGSDADRARQRVKKAIAASLARIDAEHPDLGRHLTSTVRTGYACRYEPDPRVAMTWHT